ncbi:MAG: hypothetical protein BWY41_00117 [Candidatus Atribacteria bacterium ADurb.Bin276]|uniref:Uncharacterized protein n=1 Tax=Candidatus Atribacter allofermentans TaxID=1852833 RepID=A0A1V5T3W4_9BACT|nr:MAG: hypothetical protein BWY41_00117 [Candidatus Atribacteria bacterium ADurb.Bin276]
MALIVNEEVFIRGGGHSPADCVLYGTFAGTDIGDSQIEIIPGATTNDTVAEGSSSMTKLRGITFTYIAGANATEQYPKAVKSFDVVNQREKYTVDFIAQTRWAYKLEGVDNGQAPSV